MIQINTKFIKNNDYIIKIACGGYHSLFLTHLGYVYGTGDNSCGKLGLTRALSTILKATLINENDIANNKIIDISSSYRHNLLLDQNHNLIVFGWNLFGQIFDDQDKEYIKQPTYHSFFKNNNIKTKYIETGSDHSLCIDLSGFCYLFGFGNNSNDAKVYQPYSIKSNGINNDIIIDGSCGVEHTILLSNKNNVITFGSNEYNQCSSLQPSYSNIKSPHILSKSNEIKINETNYIQKVIALRYESIIIVNCNKT